MEKEKTEPGKGYKSTVKKSSWNETKCQQPPTYYSFKEKLPPIYYINS